MTPVRAFFERSMLPAFAAHFEPSSRVLNIGAGHHAYLEYFPCRVITSDRDPSIGCDECFAAESIPYAASSVSGILLMGVFERLDDPMQAMREMRRVLRPGGRLLMSVLDLGFPWRKPSDRWRLSPGGAAHVVSGFTVIESRTVDNLAHFFVLEKGPQS